MLNNLSKRSEKAETVVRIVDSPLRPGSVFRCPPRIISALLVTCTLVVGINSAQAAATIVSIIADRSFPVAAGTTITWTVAAAGGSGPLEYQFWQYDITTSRWAIAQQYSSANTYTWTPGSWAAGPYSLQVWVKGAGSTAEMEA